MTLRERERESIAAFVQQAADDGYLSGRVLDYGCGRQPYRGIVESAGGEYFGFDLPGFPANVSGERVVPAGYDLAIEENHGHMTALHEWTRKQGELDCVLCTQVIQYIPLAELYYDSSGDGLWLDLRILMPDDRETLVLTYPTHWPEVEPEDLHRFTKAGMERLLADAGFEIVLHERRHTAAVEGELLAIGYGVIARA